MATLFERANSSKEAEGPEKVYCFHCGRNDFRSEPSEFKIEIYSAEEFHLRKMEHNPEKGICPTIQSKHSSSLLLLLNIQIGELHRTKGKINAFLIRKCK